MSFFPQFLHVRSSYPSVKAYDGIWYALLNGRGAVIVFFVLSGLVLTHRYFATGNRSVILGSAIRRWPRLMLLPLISTILMWAFASVSGDRVQLAASAAGSKWMSVALFSGTPIFTDAFSQGAFRAFFFGTAGDISYNTNLWTMWWEMAGSYVAFATAVLVCSLASPIFRYVLLSIAFVAALAWHPNIAAFIVGVGMAHAAATTEARLGVIPGLMLVLIGLLALSYLPWGWLSVLNGYGLATHRFHVYLFGATCLVAGIYFCPPIRTFIGQPLLVNFGRLSFALYVIHVPILAFFGTYAYLWLGPVVAIVVVIALSFAASVPLTRLDEKWTAMLRMVYPPSMPLTRSPPNPGILNQI